MVFSAVRTTGIYCRPGCGARPRADNVRTFEMASAAEAAGYRACLQCRPYRTRPGLPPDAPALVCRGVQLVIGGVMDTGGEAALAAQLAISPRHLRRLFEEHLGITPDQFARSRRAHFARRLLDETDLAVVDVAFASGFGSLRQFNRTMRTVFGEPPTALRARRRRSDRIITDGGVALRLPVCAGHDWPAVLSQLAVRAVPGVESIRDGVYRRTISLDGDPGVLEMHSAGPDHLLLRAHLPYWEGLIHVAARAGAVGGAEDGTAGWWSEFERACADAAGADVADLVRRHGVPVAGLADGLSHLFPSAQSLRDCELPAIRDLARAATAGELPRPA